jgi:GTP-binding protein EngB required for normal cell division
MGQRARILLAVGVVLALVAAAAGAINVAGSLADVWDRLRAGPQAVFYGLILFLVAVAFLAGWLVWTLLFPRRKRREKKPARPVTEGGLRERVEEQRALGLDVAVAERELIELARRREEGMLYLCLCGEISTGKSSLIKALAPEADSPVDVLGGTTSDVAHYRWRTPAGDEVVLADVPGTGSELDEIALAEAVRAHVVIYVTDGDLTRSEYGDLQALNALGKPLILALNKSDRYSAEELAAIAARLSERVKELGGEIPVEVVTVSAGGEAPEVTPLKRALQRQVGRSAEALDTLRDGAVFELVAQRLDVTEEAHRRERAAELVRGYTRKAVVGALAAVSPGADILIQGYLGTGLVRELCEVYGVPAKEIDVGRLLKMSQGYVGKSLPILLAVAGNALKAFPGVGTIAGGLTHAVAYGLIFDALGNGLRASLEEGGELRPAAAVRKFQENLGEDLGARTVRIARLALEERKRAE